MDFTNEKRAKALMQAEGLGEQFDADEAEDFARKHQNAKWYENFMLLFAMITDLDFKLDSKSYLIAAGALAYVVMPFDVIPDFIPIAGFIDDLFVLSVLMGTLNSEVERYKAYLKQGKV